MVARVRSNPWLAIAVAGGAILLLAWIAWAIYVATDRGAREGLGVLIAWPALVAAAALIALPFIGIYLLVRRREAGGGEPSSSEEPKDSDEAEATSPG